MSDRYDSDEFHELMMNYRSANWAAQTPQAAYEAVQAFIRADQRLSKACELLKATVAAGPIYDYPRDEIDAFLSEVGHE